MAEQRQFLSKYNARFGWNTFDSILVATALLEEVLLVSSSSSPNISVLRILRTMRIVRGFRIVRVFAFFRDLRVMVAGIVYSLYSLVWAMLLLMSMMFLFSVCLLQFAIDEHKYQTKKDVSMTTLSATDYQDMITYFGSLPKCIYTLYLSIVGGIDWGDAAKPLMNLNLTLGLLYCLYIAFAVLCVLNIITGVFVENANRTTAADEDMVMMEQMELRRQWMEEVKKLFEEADKDGSGHLDAEEFTKQLKDYRMQAWFRKIGVQIESYSAAGLFALLDFDGDGRLDLDEFSMALLQVHGPARSIDVARISRETRVMRKEVKDLTAMCLEFFETTTKSTRSSEIPMRPRRRNSRDSNQEPVKSVSQEVTSPARKSLLSVDQA
jgi:hypothetical protein